MRQMIAMYVLIFFWYSLLGFHVGSNTRDVDLLGLIPNLLGHWLVAAFINMFKIVTIVFF